MENSEVIEQETIPKDGPVQKDVEPIEGAPAVLEQNTSNMYASAKGVNQPIGEKDHAKDIAMNNNEASKTYDYNSQALKEYDESVKTTTVQSTGANMSATWDKEYKMGSDYTTKEGEDYSWNKLAAEMAQLSYDQEANQYRAESIAAKQDIDAAAASAWNNYFAAEYSARQTQEKMGWSGGQEQASDLQVQFLQAETAANMYTQDEMQRYGVETKLGIARMYADANQRALALDYYQDAVNQAVSEANLTGWYVPPEASEMFKQQELADKIISNPASTQQEIDRAKQIKANCDRYYDNLGFERGYALDKDGNVVTEYYGIKCLSMLQHEETVRNNKVNEELQDQANKIAQQQVNATYASIEVQKANLRLTKELANYTETQNIINNGENHKTQDTNNYYLDDKGNKKPLDSGVDIKKANQTYYYIDTSGEKPKARKVYNIGK